MPARAAKQSVSLVRRVSVGFSLHLVGAGVAHGNDVDRQYSGPNVVNTLDPELIERLLRATGADRVKPAQEQFGQPVCVVAVDGLLNVECQ
jgi:hypothetical protein